MKGLTKTDKSIRLAYAMFLFRSYIYRISLFVLSFNFIFPTHSLSQVLPSSSDISYLYAQEPPFYIHHQVISSENNKWVVLEINGLKSKIDSLVFGFAITSSLDKPIENFTKIEMQGHKVSESDGHQIFAINISEVRSKFIVFRILQTTSSNSFTYIVELVHPAPFIVSTTKLTLPNVMGYTSIGSPIKISTLSGAYLNYGAKFFTNPMNPAFPPMGNLKQANPFEKADSTFVISRDQLLPSNKLGTYVLFKKGEEENLTFFRVEGKNYPKIATIEKLIEASVYLFTKDENNKLRNTEEPKKAYDAFWINNTNSTERAKKMIAAYFNRVKEANAKFTLFKEGWKTDMGMIYIIFGPPNKVYRTDDGMQWIYKKTYELPSITFKFYSNNKYFTSDYFELERSIEYQTVWFRAIELWRKGRKNL